MSYLLGVVIMARALSLLVAVAAAAFMFAAPAVAQPKNCQVQCLSQRYVSSKAWSDCINACMSTGGGSGSSSTDSDSTSGQ
jgi:hypothetical protein